MLTLTDQPSVFLIRSRIRSRALGDGPWHQSSISIPFGFQKEPSRLAQNRTNQLHRTVRRGGGRRASSSRTLPSLAGRRPRRAEAASLGQTAIRGPCSHAASMAVFGGPPCSGPSGGPGARQPSSPPRAPSAPALQPGRSCLLGGLPAVFFHGLSGKFPGL